MITEEKYLKAKKIVADYELSNGIKPIVIKSVCNNCRPARQIDVADGKYCGDCGEPVKTKKMKVKSGMYKNLVFDDFF